MCCLLKPSPPTFTMGHSCWASTAAHKRVAASAKATLRQTALTPVAAALATVVTAATRRAARLVGPRTATRPIPRVRAVLAVAAQAALAAALCRYGQLARPARPRAVWRWRGCWPFGFALLALWSRGLARWVCGFVHVHVCVTVCSRGCVAVRMNVVCVASVCMWLCVCAQIEGSVFIVIDGTAQVNVKGGPGGQGPAASGGGSGGSIVLLSNNVVGDGAILAGGGVSSTTMVGGGGGGGGRVLFHASSWSPPADEDDNAWSSDAYVPPVALTEWWTSLCVSAGVAIRVAEGRSDAWFSYPELVALCGGGVLPSLAAGSAGRRIVFMVDDDGVGDVVSVRASDVVSMLEGIAACRLWECVQFQRCGFG